MIKQNLVRFSAAALILALGLVFGNIPAFAEENPVTNCIGGNDTNCITVYTVDEPGDADFEDLMECFDDEADNGKCSDATEGRNEITCIASDASLCEDVEKEVGIGLDEDEAETEEEEEGEPATWPMYVSLGALGAAVLIFIVLNLFGGRKK